MISRISFKLCEQVECIIINMQFQYKDIRQQYGPASLVHIIAGVNLDRGENFDRYKWRSGIMTKCGAPTCLHCSLVVSL